MKKLILLLVLCSAVNGCSKDECGCYYSNEVGLYFPNKFEEEDYLSGDKFALSEEQLQAVQAECRVRENCN